MKVCQKTKILTHLHPHIREYTATDCSQALHLNKVHPSINQHEFSGKNIETIRLERRHIGARLSEVHNLRSPAHLQLGFCTRRTCHTFRRTHSRIHDEIIMVLFPAGHIAKKNRRCASVTQAQERLIGRGYGAAVPYRTTSHLGDSS